MMPSPTRDQPAAGLHVHAVDGKFRRKKAQPALRAFEPPERAETKCGRQTGTLALVASAGGNRLPDDFVDGVAFADGVHHLADEERQAAGFVFLQRVGGGEMIVEIFERLFLLLGGGGIIDR